MIKFLGIGKDKPEAVKGIGKGFIPTDRVNELSGKGFSEPEIIDVLRKEGFSAEEIDRGLTQALKIGVTGAPQPAAPQAPNVRQLQTQQPAFLPPPQTQPQFVQAPEASMQQYVEYPEEIVESVVNERMAEMDEKLVEFREKYLGLERSISNLHNQLTVLSKGRGQRDEVLLGKIDALKESMTEIEGKVSSLDRAFKEALPALIESVRSLSDLVQRFKTE